MEKYTTSVKILPLHWTAMKRQLLRRNIVENYLQKKEQNSRGFQVQT
jgi:hypothetical protein